METILSRIGDFQGFQKPRVQHHDADLFNTALPSFQISNTKSGLLLDVNLDDLDRESTVGSTINKDHEIPVDQILNFVHDFTVAHLTKTTDSKFSENFPLVGDGFDGHTPDDIIITPGQRAFVIEYTTNRGTERQAEQAAYTKFAKYELACQNRSQAMPIMLCVISVHRDGVWSNLPLTQSEVDELVFRFRLSIAIFGEIREISPDALKDDQDLGKTEREVLGIISQITMDWTRTSSIFPAFQESTIMGFLKSNEDEEYVNSIVAECMDKAAQDLIRESHLDSHQELGDRLSLNKQLAEIAIDSRLEEYSSGRTMRPEHDKKSTVQFPPWVTYEGPEGKDLNPLTNLRVEGTSPLAKIWTAVVTNSCTEEIQRMNDDPEEELRLAMENSLSSSDQRKAYHRTVLQLNDTERVYAATLGVEAKKFRDYPLVRDARSRSKLPFSPHHDTNSISHFLFASGEDFLPDGSFYSPCAEDLELRRSAAQIHQPTLLLEKGENEWLNNHKNYLDSAMGSWLQMASSIGSELAASVKQHCKPGQFIVKRLLNSGIYMLIKPTNSDSHIFVSLGLDKNYWARDLVGADCFKAYEDIGDLYATDFVSFKVSKLTNVCKSDSVIPASACFWAEQYGIKPWQTWHSEGLSSNSPSCKEARTMLRLSLLGHFEDKAITEELQTILRYVTMEGFVSQPELPKPAKMLGKLPKVLRTTLQVWLLNRVITTMRVISNKPFSLVRSGKTVKWSNLFNPYTGAKLNSLQTLVSCWYTGYFKNKEEPPEVSGLSKLYEKIIELESAKPRSDKFLGRQDPKHPAMHEYSVSYLKRCCSHAKTLLRRLYGQDFMRDIDNDILSRFCHLTLESMATLKASSNFDKSWYVHSENKGRSYSRSKVITRVAPLTKSGKRLVIESFQECMDRVEENGCMHVCLFKKNQHGGLREIYVMGFEERVIQLCVETIARSICKLFPSETLNNPKNKTRIPETHGTRARKHCGSAIWTTGTSDDARKWNQGHYVVKFAQLLCSFTQPKWWPIIIRGCSMFTKKRMMLDPKYMDILDKHMELEVEDEFVTTLFKAYHGEVEVPWFKKGCSYLETETGMMQGILHNTSSLLHTIHQEFVRTLTFTMFRTRIGPEFSSRVVCDVMQGSDDSAMLISFPSEDPELLAKAKVVSATCFRLKRLLGIYLAIYPSEKSTTNTDFLLEYNSEFFFHIQHIRPTIRWIAASMSIPEVETLIARQEESYNLLASTVEGGASFSLAACIQQCQVTLHYRLFGMGVSTLFSHYAKHMIRWRDPGLGFFLLDNPYIAGLAGVRYNLFKAVTRTELGNRYSWFLKGLRQSKAINEDQSSMVSESCTVSPGGAIVQTSVVRWGNRKKYERLVESMDLPEDWIESINRNPIILYRAPQTGEEALLRICEKMNSPGIASSLSKGNVIPRVMASSVYALSAAIYQDIKKKPESPFGDGKYSLLSRVIAYETSGILHRLEPDDIIFLFPNIEELEKLDEIAFDRGEIQVRPRSSMRESTQTRVQVLGDAGQYRVSPDKLVCDKWFLTQRSKVSKTLFEDLWARLRSTVSWLRDTPEETLEASPLASHVQIRNFLARMETKPRFLSITGAPVKKKSGLSKMLSVLRDNFARDAVLDDIEDHVGLSKHTATELVKHSLFCALQGPYTDSAKEQLVQYFLNRLPEIPLREQDGKTRSNILAILQKHMSSKESVIPDIISVGAGIVGGFTRVQRSSKREGKVFYHGPGTWRGVMDGVQVQIDIDNREMEQPQLTSITVSGTTTPWAIIPSLQSWCLDVGVLNSADLRSKSRPGAKFWIHGFRMSGPSSPYGVPVYIVNSRISDELSRSDMPIQMKVRNSTINLFTRSRFTNKDLHILSYTASDQDISSASISALRKCEDQLELEMLKKEPTYSWFNCSPMNVSLVEALAEVLEGKRSTPPHIDVDRLSGIFRMSCESSLRARIGGLPVLAEVKIENNSNFNLQDMIGEVMMSMQSEELFEQAVDAIEMPSILDDFNVEEELDLSGIEAFGPSYYKELSNLSLMSHPLMDTFVEHVLETIGQREVRRVLSQARCKPSHYDLCCVLFRVLGRDPARIRRDVFERIPAQDIEDSMLG
uniref:RNA-directed RNA polymerase L n=1 Tax=Alxa tick phlebovirus TaxID=2977130 RepID=A0A977WM88_9VIRU|nr:MAG: RNA-dependent RNA polymerase [Alxa tick phlebovirus]